MDVDAAAAAAAADVDAAAAVNRIASPNSCVAFRFGYTSRGV